MSSFSPVSSLLMVQLSSNSITLENRGFYRNNVKFFKWTVNFYFVGIILRVMHEFRSIMQAFARKFCIE